MKISLAILPIIFAACTPCAPDAPIPATTDLTTIDQCVGTDSDDATDPTVDMAIPCDDSPPTFVVGGPWGPCDAAGECAPIDGQPVFCISTVEGKICLPTCEQEACPAELKCLGGACDATGTCNLNCDEDADCVGRQTCDEQAGFCVYAT